MNGKLLDYYIVAAILACCLVFGIMGGVWSSSQGHHPLLAFGIGCLLFLISIGVVIIFCNIVGISFDIIAKRLKKGGNSFSSLNKEETPTSIAATPQTECNATPQELDLVPAYAINQQKSIERKNKLKEFFKLFIEKKVSMHLSTKGDAAKLYSNICNVIDNGEIEGSQLEEVKNSNLSNEDIFHLGFMLKFYLKKDNEFGASFIYKVFAEEFKKGDGVDYGVICVKLASNRAYTHFIELPPSRLREEGRSKSVAGDGDLEKDFELLLA